MGQKFFPTDADVLTSKQQRNWGIGLVALVTLLGLTPAPARALPIDLKPPGEKEFIRDLAGLINEPDQVKIREICTALLRDKATPIIVVTIESMAKYGGADLRIETFARLLFDQWGIGQVKLGDQPWNTGILLLVSKEDRKARIELGAGWAHDKDVLCQQIMNEQIVPYFKQGDYSAGILAGVVSLDRMARGLKLPTRPVPWWTYALIGGFLALVVGTFINLARRGASGWAWVLWSVIFGILGYLLVQLLSNRSNSGFSGGSFGGGFSGGGGATGSW